MTSKNNTLAYRVGRLEESVKALDGKIDMILENHLPHLKLDMADLRSEIKSLQTRVAVATALNISAIIVASIVLKGI